MTRTDVEFLVRSGIAGAASWRFFASKVVPVDRASVLFLLVLFALFLGEKITVKTTIAGFLIFVDIRRLVVNLD